LAVSIREELDNIRSGHTWQSMQESDVRSVGLCQIVKIEWNDAQETDKCVKSEGRRSVASFWRKKRRNIVYQVAM